MRAHPGSLNRNFRFAFRLRVCLEKVVPIQSGLARGERVSGAQALATRATKSKAAGDGGLSAKTLSYPAAVRLVPAKRLYNDWRSRSTIGHCAFFARVSVRHSAASSPKPNRSSNSRTRISPPPEVTREPWKSTLREALKES